MELKSENNLLKLEIDYLAVEDGELIMGKKTLIIGIYEINPLNLENQESTEMKEGENEQNEE